QADAPASNGNGTSGGATQRRDAPSAPSRKYFTITELNEKKPKELADVAKDLGLDGGVAANKQVAILQILQAQTEAHGNIFAQGILEIVEDGFGFLRRRSLLPSPE